MRRFDHDTTSDHEADLLDSLSRMRSHGRAASRAAIRAELERALPRSPLKVQIQTASHCNAACGMCPYPVIAGEPGFEHRRMSEGLYRRILDELRGRGVERLSLFLMNEPLLDKRLPDWLALARTALPETTLGLFTNGSALSADLAARLDSAGLDELCVSVHGFDKSVYEDIMVGLSFDRLQRNLRDVFALRSRGGLRRIRIKLVSGDVEPIRQTLDEAPAALRDHVLLKAFSNECGVLSIPDPVGPSAPATTSATAPLCQRPFVKLYILASGECVLCNVDWRRSVVLGRVRETGGDSIEEIWNGAAYRNVRIAHLLGRFEPDSICSGCDYAHVADNDGIGAS